MKHFLDKAKQFFSIPETVIFIATFIVHEAIVVLLLSGIVRVPTMGSDQATYSLLASQIAVLLRSHTYTWGAVYSIHWYPLFVAILYRLFGQILVLGISFNALLSAGSAVLLYLCMKKAGGSERISFWFSLVAVNCYASFMYTSSLLLKEPWIVFLFLFGIYLSIRMSEREHFSWGIFAVFIITFVLLRSLRFFDGFALLVFFFSYWFIESPFLFRTRLAAGMGMLIVVSAIAYMLTGNILGQSASIFQYVRPQAIQTVRQGYYENGATTTHIQVIVSEKGTYAFSGKGIAQSFFDAVLGPFPWQLPFKKYMLAAIDLLCWYFVLILACVGAWKIGLKKSVPYLLTGGVLLAALTFGVDNLGALLRYRIPLLFLLAVIAPVGFEMLRRKIVKIKLFSEVGQKI